MTGRELIVWIMENKAEDREAVWIGPDEIVWEAKPTLEKGSEINCCGLYGERLADEEEYIVL